MAEKYTPLYRKYRPQKFDELIGQDAVSNTLSNAVKLNRIAHAYLFTGPRGTGKTSSARIFARSLNCVEGPTVHPCGKCHNCIDITNSNSVDVIEIDAASNRKVEDARNLLEKVQFVPVSGRYKIYIIDEVHMLTTEAFNTLLKTLEEPPENLVFILATTESHKVLNTIISRCQRFDFRRVSQELITDNLRKISDKENIKIEDKALSLIAKKAYGGMRDAVGLLDQASVLSAEDRIITEADIISLLGSLSEDTLFKITECISQKNAENLMLQTDEIIQSCEPVNVIRELINYFRNLLIVRTGKSLDAVKHLVNISESLLSEIKLQADGFEVNEIVQIIEKLSEFERNIKNTSQQHLWLEIALISICHRQDIQVIQDLEERLSKLEKAVSTGNISPPLTIDQQNIPSLKTTPESKPEKPAVDPKPAVSEPQEPLPAVSKTGSAVNTENIETAWKQLLSVLSKINAPSEAFFRIFTPVKLDTEGIIITSKNDKWVEKAKKEKINLLEQAIKQLFPENMPNILIRTPLPEDDELKKNNTQEQPKQEVTPAYKPQKASTNAQIAIDTEVHQEIEPEVAENLDNMSKNLTPVNISEQAKMVLDVFDGKIIE